MKILVFGAGVLGCNLAGNLFRAGKDTTLLARGNWAGDSEERSANQGQVFTPRVGQPDSSRDRIEARKPVRCDLRCPALYAVGLNSGDAAGESDKEHRLCWQ